MPPRRPQGLSTCVHSSPGATWGARSVCIVDDVHLLVCQAIAQRKVIRFHYDGGTRDIEPHIHGFGQDGVELLRGYQVSGFSRSGQVSGWKMFRLAEVRAMAVTDRRFASPRAGYEPADALMPTIHCRL
jgi:hypothetical protein